MFGGFIKKCMAQVAHLTGSFYANDPTTPDLIINGRIPQPGLLKYEVRGMSLSPKNMNESRSLNCHIVTGNCIEMMQKQVSAPVKKWAATQSLQIVPDAGVDMNAYYDRRSLKFFYYNFGNKNYYFSDSADIITHELGHAFLDAMRPDFWSVQALEIWSFHEAFSDITAMFHIMNYDVAIEKVLAETKGDLSVSNSISKIAEEVGMLIRAVTRSEAYLADSLRNPATEKYKYVNPSKLPNKSPNNSLAAECHSFGRVFSAAWYAIFVKIYNHFLSSGESPISSFKKSRDFCYSTLLNAIPNSPRVPDYYAAVAKSMLAVSKSKNPVFSEIMRSVFLEWNIIDDKVKLLSSISYKELARTLKKEDVVFKNSKTTTVCIKENREMRVSSLPLLGTMNIKEDFSVELASDSYYQFDPRGNLVDQLSYGEEEAKSAAAQSLLMIQGEIGKGKMWEVEDEKLVRKFI